MAPGRKAIATRLEDFSAKEHAERLCLEDLTNSFQKDVQSLVADTAKKVYQLRGRTVTNNTPKGSRRKKAAKTDKDVVQDMPQGAAGLQLQPVDAPASAPAPASELAPGPVTGLAPEPTPTPAAASGEQETAEDVREAAQDPPEATDVELKRAGNKRGRPAAGAAVAAQAKSKRTKAQAVQPGTADALPAVAPSDGASLQALNDKPAVADKDISDHAEATAVHCEPVLGLPPPQPFANVEDSAAAPGREEPATKPAPTDLPTETQTALPAPEPRVTRSRRVQLATANAPVSTAPAGKRMRERGTGQKRDLNMAQFGSPGLHPKTKAATNSGAASISVPEDDSAAASKASDAAALKSSGAAAASPLTAGPAPVRDEPGAGTSRSDLNARLRQSPAAAGEHLSIRQSEGEPGEAVAMKDQPSTELSARDLDRNHTHPGAGTEPCSTVPNGLDRDAAQLQEPASGSSEQERVSISVPGTAMEEPSDDAAVGDEDQMQQPAPVSRPPNPQPRPDEPPAAKGMVTRLPANIAATVALYGGRARHGGTSGLLDAANEPAWNDQQSSRVGPAAGADTEAPGAVSEHFTFGTKPKEQSSPNMPHFGVASEQAAATLEATTDAASPNAECTAEKVEPSASVASPVAAPECAGRATPGPVDAEPMGATEHAATPMPSEVGPADAGDGDGDERDDENRRPLTACQDLTVQGTGVRPHAELRNRSLSLSVPLRSPSFMLPGPETVPQQDPGDTVEPVDTAADPFDLGSSRASELNQLPMRPSTEARGTEDDDEVVACDDDGPDSPGPSCRQVSCEPDAQNGDAADASGRLDERIEGGGETAEACDDAGESDEQEPHDSSGAGARISSAQAVSAQKGVAVAHAEDDQHGSDLRCVGQAETVQQPKPKGGNVVSAIRSFLPQRTAPSPPPAAGKKTVKVKALEAAQAAKQKEAARAAERALARAAAADRRQAPGEAGLLNGGGKPGVHAPGSARLTPIKSVTQQGADAIVACTTLPTSSAALAHPGLVNMTVEEKRSDCTAAAAVAGSVKAKAAFFQLKEEQAKKAAVENGAGRKQGGAAAVSGAPSYKAGANARVALAVGDNDAALEASAVPALHPAQRPQGPSASGAAPPAPSASRGTIQAPIAQAAETAADKHKRVEAKRREEEERRRAELEARTKAKDDKLRNFEAAKQQQRAGGGGGALRPPAPVPGNPLALQPAGKRPPLNAAGTGQGPIVQVKPEPEAFKTGPAGPSSARTPGPSACPARTPGPKAGQATSNMVSPAVQLQVKLLPAVHAQAAPAEGGRVGGGAPGLPKPRPPGTAHVKQAQAAPVTNAAVGKASRATPATGDLTEEDRRNVHAIQTSPYVQSVKPRTPGLATATKPTFVSYEISPYRSDSDDLTDDEDEPGRVRKPVPAWAAGDAVVKALSAQAGLDPDLIFGTYPSTIDLVKVFSDMPPPGKTDARGRPRRDYRRRGSSGVWDADMP